MTVFAADLAQDGGARTAVAIMESILLDIMFDLPGPEGVKEVVISRQLVEDTTPPLCIYANRPDRTGDAGRAPE
jgi:ATP-dependent Clp protease ATP-binding subunit ClpX